VSDVRIRIRIDLGPGRAVGPGKIELLEALDQTGSLVKAARQLGMSYRRAWLLLKALNELTDEPLATSVKGGSGGGGATLTPHGRAMIRAFRAVEAAALQAGQSQFAAWAATDASADTTAIRRLPVSDATPPSTRRVSAKR
jgi:molybdate transport system regulatory protein